MNPQSAAVNPLRTPANQSQFTFSVQGLADNSFGVKAFRGEDQALDQDYRFEVALLSPDLILPERVIGQSATLELLQSAATTPMIISGVVCAFTWDEAAPGSRGYVATLASPLYPLTLRNNQRIFLNRSIPQIIEEVLTQAGLNATVEMELQGEYPARAYTVQYDESDWDFFTRLAAYCGIFFRIEAEQEQARILFHDAVDTLPTLPGTGTLLYQPQTGANRAQETIFSFNTRAEVLTDGVDLRDYNYRTPEALLDASASRTVSAAGHGRDYRYGENHKDLDQATQLAKLRQQQLDWQRQLYYAASDCRTVAPGLRLTMTGHPEIDLNGEYLIVAVEQQGQQKSALAYGENSQGMTYRNRLTLIPFATPYRPKLPQPRRNHGVFTAHIETTGGTYAYLDDQGRYRVRLAFDGADALQGQASHAARLLQPYSGDNFGTHTPLHAGTEVALTCVNGDLDRPIILGVLPNPQTPSPVNATNHSQNILRTFGDNELLMEDRKGQERIELFTRARNNILSLDAQESGHKISLLSHQGEMELYAAKTLLKESGDTHSTVVGDNHLITVENSQRLMTKNQQIELKAATDIRIKAADNIYLQAEKKDIQLRADKDMIVHAATGMSVEVRNENLSLLVTNGELSIDVAKQINILGQGGGAITIGQSGGTISIDPQGNINIDSHTVDINGQSVSIDGAQSSQGGGGSGTSAGGSGGSNPKFGLLTTLPGAARNFFEPNEDVSRSQTEASGTGSSQDLENQSSPKSLTERQNPNIARKILVKAVDGPNYSEVGGKVVYKVTKFNLSDPTAEEIKTINWRVETHSEEILAEFKSHGERLEFTADEKFLGRPIRIHAYISEPTESASATTITSREFNLLVATVYGEAGNSSVVAWKAIASVILNRIDYREWKKQKSVLDVIKNTGFDAYWQHTNQFKIASDYLENIYNKKNRVIDKIVTEVKNIYLEKEEPIKDIVLYFSPKAQKILNKKYPQLYSEKPKWNFDLLTEVKIKGLMSDDDFKFYKYK